MTEIYFGQTYRNGIGTRDPAGGSIVAADSAPDWGIYEDDTDTAILTGSFTARASTTGKYRMTASLTKANGFEMLKYYEVWAETTVNTIDDHAIIDRFFLLPPRLSLYATVATVTDNGDFTIAAVPTMTLPATDDAVNDCYMVFCSGNNKGVPRAITDYVQSTGQVTFEGAAGEPDEEFPRTVVVDDIIEIIGLNR
jgi:hypothetical protein